MLVKIFGFDKVPVNLDTRSNQSFTVLPFYNIKKQIKIILGHLCSK